MLMFGDYNIKDVLFGNYKVNYIYYDDNLIWSRNSGITVPEDANIKLEYESGGNMFNFASEVLSYVERIWVNNEEQYGNWGDVILNDSDVVFIKFTNNTIPSKLLAQHPFYGETYASAITIYDSVIALKNEALMDARYLRKIESYATTAPELLGKYVFDNIAPNGTLYYPCGSDYSSWEMNLSKEFWTIECKNSEGDVTLSGQEIIAIFNVDSASEYQICNDASTYFNQITVDDVVVSKSEIYAFPSAGKYTLKYDLKADITSLGSVFQNCSQLEQIEQIPSNVTEINYSTFRGCTKLASFNIPSTLKTIGNSVFLQCSSLTSITIPDTVTSIGSSAFASCGLINAEIPNSISSITGWVFDGCTSLTSVTLPDTITSIGDYTFRNCSALKSITINALKAPSINSAYTFQNIAKDGVLYYPCGSDYSSWLSTDANNLGYYNWTSECTGGTTHSTGLTATFYFTYELTNREVQIINANALSAVTSMKVNGTEIPLNTHYSYSAINTEYVVEYTLADKTKIPEKFLFGLDFCTDVTIPDSVTSIVSYAFNDCSNLTSVTIGSGVKSIGLAAFQYCKKLNSIRVNAITAPQLSTLIAPLYSVGRNGTLYYPCGSDYSSWINYLTDYDWTSECF